MNAVHSETRTVVLVHGAWADGGSWRRVVPHLLARSIPVIGVQNPTTSLVDDVAATRNALALVKGDVVLVGHSWGGAVITEAGNDPKVKSLVFVAAFAPKAGQSVGAYPPPPALSQIVEDGAGFLRLSVDGWTRDVGQDLPAQEARVLAALQTPLAKTTFAEKVTQAAWEHRPNWYVVSDDDRVVSVEIQRRMAADMKATTTELKAGHLSLLSKPEAVASVIVDAVEATKTRVAA